MVTRSARGAEASGAVETERGERVPVRREGGEADVFAARFSSLGAVKPRDTAVRVEHPGRASRRL